MHTPIPRFAELIAPLRTLLESQYVAHGTRKKSCISNRLISAWGEEHDATFKCLMTAIVAHVKLVAPDPSNRLCLFTDA